jgi:hypothetical protein
MSHDVWVSVADAADIIGTPDAPQVINLVRKRRVIPLCGVRAGESEPMEIPFGETGAIDCENSWIGDGMFMLWHHVVMQWADVKRLAQADVDRLLKQGAETSEQVSQSAETQDAPQSAETEQAPQRASTPADVLAAKAGPLVKAVALVLIRIFPNGRPLGSKREQILLRVCEAAGERTDWVSLATLDRAVPLAWPRA